MFKLFPATPPETKLSQLLISLDSIKIHHYFVLCYILCVIIMFTLPKLPYSYAALEPHIDARTMEIHHAKHHQAYIDKLNKALENFPDLQIKSIENLLQSLNDLPEEIRLTVRNNGGGHYNHSLFWQIMAPNAGGRPTGATAKTIDKNFGSFEKFQEEFNDKAAKIFGSGWAWLIKNSNNKLQVITMPNQDSPVTDGLTPLLGLDIWEHAYYLKYQNRRAEYISAWWNVINWRVVEENFNK